MTARPFKFMILFSVVAVATASLLGLPDGQAADDKESGPMLAHMVFFELKNDTPENSEALVAACYKYLSDLPGVVHFSAGTRAEEYDRPVNDQKFNVALHVVFKDKASHDAYQTAPRHLEFIEKNKDLWSGVRVFDSVVH